MEDYDFGQDFGDILEQEFSAYERAGPGGKLQELLSIPLNPEKKRQAYTPTDKFLIKTDSLCRELDHDSIAKFPQQVIDDILVKAYSTPNIQYKNPLGFILGYLATNNGSKLKKENVMFVIKTILPKLKKDSGIEPEDVIRYARFWTKYL
jgi:hypothetical protein